MANPVVLWMHATVAAAWTNMPAAATEFFGNAQRRVIADCTGFTQVRVRWRQVVTGATGAVLRLRYATDDSNFTTIGSDVSIVGTGWKDTGWMTLPVGARVNNCTFQLQGQGGDGVADPQFSSVSVWLQ